MVDGSTFTLPRPSRHQDIVSHLVDKGVIDRYPRPSQFGFVDKAGTFLDRRDAARIAALAGQILPGRGLPIELTTHDLW